MPPRRRVAKNETAMSVSDMLETIGQSLKNQSKEPNILAYKPHDKQKIFHASKAHTRLYIGGNRSGKTVGGVTEDIYYLRGSHPYKRVPEPPVRGRVVCVDFNQGISQIIIPKLKQWLPPSLLINGSWDDSYHTLSKTLTLSNGSTLELMTYEQKLESFAGTSRHFCHFDEEPPKAIYDECQMRLMDTDGDTWITMTPVEGMSWIFDTIYEPGVNGDNPDIEVVIISSRENPYLNPAALDRILGSLDTEERKARELGEFIQLGGLVYKKFSKDLHVVPAVDLKSLRGCKIYASMDHGYNAPTAWLWHAVYPDGSVVTFDEHYQNEMIVKDHAEIVLAKEKAFAKAGLQPTEIKIADPATAQRNGVTGTSIQTEYAKYGVYLASGNNDVLSGVNQVTSYLRSNPATGRPYRVIAENCPNLIREMQRLRWKTYASKKLQYENNPQEQIHKKDDHAADADRYFFSFMPELKWAQDPREPKQVPVATPVIRYDEALHQMYGNGGTVEEKTMWMFSDDPSGIDNWEM